MPPVKHPHPFEDLVELARPTTYDPQRSFKDQLRAIDVLRDQSQAAREDGDLENAYIYLGRAAAVINDHLPGHSQYNMLTTKQQTDLANNGRLMLRSLTELEPDLKERYQAYQDGIANGTIQPPKRRRNGEEKEKRKASERPAEPAPITMPRTPTSIEDHTTRSMKPTPGVTVMLSEAQERERQNQLDRDRRKREREYRSSDDDRRAHSFVPGPVPESAIPTPIPTPDRRETSTLSISQHAPSTSHYDRQREEAERARREVEQSDANMRAAMYRLQEEYDSKLAACLENPQPITETERMERALEIVTKTGAAERQWIEEKGRLAIRHGRPSTFDKELNDQVAVHEQRIKDIRQIFQRRNDEAAQRRQAELRALAQAEERERELRFQAERDMRQRHADIDASRDRYRSDREYSDAERSTRSREDQLLHDREMSAAQDAMARVSIAQRQRAEEEAAYSDRQRRAVDAVQATLHRGQAERAHREAATSHRDLSGHVPRASRVQSPIIPPVSAEYSRQPSPAPPLTRPQSGRIDQPQSSAYQSVPSVPRSAPAPVSPIIPHPGPMRRPQHSRGDLAQPASAPPPTSQPPGRSRSPVSYASSSTPPLQHSMEHEFMERSIPSLHSRPSNIQMGGRSNSQPLYYQDKPTSTYPQEKLAAIAALPAESPSHSFRGSLSDEYRDPGGRVFPITTTTSPPPSELLPIAGQSPNYPALMSRHQKSQGYVPSRQSMFAEESSDTNGGTPNGLLFQPVGVTKVPAASDPYGKSSSNRPGSFNRASTNGPFPLPPRLRQVRLPSDTLQRFVALAALNTAKKKETLGMLYGKFNNVGGLDITTLLIPRQTSTENSCNMTHEELLVEYAERRTDTVPLGWIHTHPTQSCFMSSTDLHTQAGFQKSIPEAISIVCAPRHQPNFGIFRLTDPPGLPLILKCENPALFHPHPDNVPIYTDADSEHVIMVKDSFIEIVDLR